MADPPADSADEPTPRWVKVSGSIAIVLVLLFAVVHLTGHGLGGHHHGGRPPPSHATEHGAPRP